MHALSPVSRFLRLLGPGMLACWATIGTPAQEVGDLVATPRLGVVSKVKTGALKTKIAGLSEALLAWDTRVEIVVLEKLPSKSSKTASPRFVLVIEEAEAEPTGAVTEEYEGKSDIGETSRIRWRGAVARARATLHACANGAAKVAEFTETIDQTRPPKTYVFKPDEAKKEIVVDPARLLGTAVENVVRHALAYAAGSDLWPYRAELAPIAKDLVGDEGAAFWTRAAWAAEEPMPARAVVPWRSLEAAALALWRGAHAKTQARGHPAENCAWCGAASSGSPGECACDEAAALERALQVLRYAASRQENAKERGSALKIEVAFDELHPAHPPADSAKLDALARRLDAEHAADLAVLRSRLGLDVMKGEVRLDWYVVLALRDPLDWRPDDPDFVRHAARVVQAFGYRTGIAGASFDVESASPAIGLVQRRSGWEYTAVDKREFTNAKTDLLADFVERAVWANARGTPKAP